MTITFEQAKESAENTVKEIIEDCGLDIQPPYLADLYLEEERCWMFFTRENYPGQLSCVFSNLSAFAQSKKSLEGRILYNYLHDIEKAKAYNKEVSGHFAKLNI